MTSRHPPGFDPEATVQLDPEATVRLALPSMAPPVPDAPLPDPALPATVPDPEQGGPPRESSVQAVARGGGANLVGAGITTVANLLLSVVVARSMSQADAGIFFSITSLVLLLATVGRVGTGGGAIYFLPRLRLLGSPAEVSECLRLSIRPTLVVSSVLGLGLLLFAPQIADLAVGRDPSPDAVLVLRLSGLVLPFAALGDVLQSITRGFGRMRTTVMVERIGRPLAQLMLVVLAAPTHNVLLLVLAWTVPYLPATILSGLPVRRLARENRRRRSAAEPSGFTRAEYWRFTGPRALTAVTQVGLQRADVLLVVAILGPVQAALYAAATRFLVVGQLGNQAISVALQPRLSAALARRDLDEAGLLYRTATGWLVLTTWPLYLLVGAFPAALLGIFGHKYASATDVVVVLCAAMLVATASGQVDTVLMMAGKSTWNLANAALALVVQLGLDLLLLPHLGILGAAIGWAVSILVANLVPLGQLSIAFGLHPVGRSSVLAVLICTVAVVPVAVVARVVGGDHLVPALAATAVAVLLWAIGLWWFRDPLMIDAFFASRRRKRGPGGGPSGGPGPNGDPGPNDSPGPAGGRASTGDGSTRAARPVLATPPAGEHRGPGGGTRPARSGRPGRGRHRA